MAQETATLTIKLIDFKKHEADMFSAILNLAEFGLHRPWAVVNTEVADFYLLPEKPKTNDYKGLPSERCIYYNMGTPSTYMENGIQIDSDRTPGLQSLIKLFNRIAPKTAQLSPAFPVSSLDEMTLPEEFDKPTTKPALAKAASEKQAEKKPVFVPLKPLKGTVAAQISNLALAFPASSLDEMALSEEFAKPAKRPTTTRVSPDKQPETQQADIPPNPQKELIAAQLSELSSTLAASLDGMDMSERFFSKLNPQSTLAASAKQLSTKRADIPFNPQQGILKHLLAETTQPMLFMLKGKSDFSPIYAYPEKKVFYCPSPLEKLTPYFVIDKNLVSAPMSVTELNKAIKKQSLTAQPLSYLIWYAAFKLSKGRMMLGHSSQDLFYLKKIPYRDANNVDYLSLAIYWLDNIASIEIAAKETGLAFDKAIDFYNASYLIGLIQQSTETGFALEVAHEYFSTDYIDGLIAKTMDFELNLKLPKPAKQAGKQGLMNKFINRLKN
jgi:hypothetical protein